MGLPVDLEEVPLSKLKSEIARRKKLEAAGFCSYCRRSKTHPSCKMRVMHEGEFNSEDTVRGVACCR